MLSRPVAIPGADKAGGIETKISAEPLDGSRLIDAVPGEIDCPEAVVWKMDFYDMQVGVGAKYIHDFVCL